MFSKNRNCHINELHTWPGTTPHVFGPDEIDACMTKPVDLTHACQQGMTID